MLTVPEQNRERGGSTESGAGTTGTTGGGGSARSSQHDLLEMLLLQGRSELTSATKTVPASLSELLRRLSDESDLPRIPSDPNDQSFEEFLSLKHLEEIMKLFQSTDDVDKSDGVFNRPSHEFQNLTLEELQRLISTAIGSQIYNEQIEKLFNRMDTSGDAHVDWADLCTYLLLHLREKEYLESKAQPPVQAYNQRARMIAPNHSDTTSKIIVLESPYRILTVSKKGIVSVWQQPGLVMQKTRDSFGGADPPFAEKKRYASWCADMVHMPNCHRLAASTSSRELLIIDASSGNYDLEFCIYGFTSVFKCLDYWYDKKNIAAKSYLYCGEENGSVWRFEILKPTTSIIGTNFTRVRGSSKEDPTRRIWFSDIDKYSSTIRYEVIRDLLPNNILQLRYLQDNDQLLVCCDLGVSASHQQPSLVFFDMNRRVPTYSFKIHMGCNCFDLSKALNYLVTGSNDHKVRLWNPYVPARPIAVLVGHKKNVSAVHIYEELLSVISYSVDAVIKTWSLFEYNCLQTINLSQPVVNDLRDPEHGPFPIALITAPQSSYGGLYVACNDYIVHYPMGNPKEPKLHTTHKLQLCAAIYNPVCKQVITGSDDSCVIAWDLATGAKSIAFNNAHGGEEITSLGLDDSGRRLITGARNGVIKVWNLLNGHNLHHFQPVDDSEITRVVHVADRRVFCAVGWARCIAEYEDTEPDNQWIHLKCKWGDNEGVRHSDDVLSADYASRAHLLATASFDGELLVWSTETQRLVTRLRRRQEPKIKQQIKELLDDRVKGELGSRPSTCGGSRASRPNSRHRLSHAAPPPGQQAPVDKLLFLQRRVQNQLSTSAILVSSEAGQLHFWSLYGRHRHIAYFYAAQAADESILGLCSDDENQLLAAADTQGVVSIWDISNLGIELNDKSKEYPMVARVPLLRTWKAHNAACVSTEWISDERGPFLVTAATDCCAKLFSLAGEEIGTFGQERPWSLLEKSTWTMYEDTFEKYREQLLSRSASGVGSRTNSVGEMSRPLVNRAARDMDSAVSVNVSTNGSGHGPVSAPNAGTGGGQRQRATTNAPTTAPSDSRTVRAPKYGQTESTSGVSTLPAIGAPFVTKSVTFSGPNRDHREDGLPFDSLRREKTTLGVSLEASFERMREVKAERRRVLTAHCTPEQMARTVKRTPNVFQLLRTTDVEEPNLQQANMTETTTRFRLLAEQSGLPQVPTVLGGSAARIHRASLAGRRMSVTFAGETGSLQSTPAPGGPTAASGGAMRV